MWLCFVPSFASILHHPLPPPPRSRWHMGEQTSSASKLIQNENCTNEINKNPAVLGLLWLYPVKRTLCSLPDDATINEIPVIDCFKLLWRLETGQCEHDRRRKKKKTLFCFRYRNRNLPRDRHCSEPTRFYLAFSYNPYKYALFCCSSCQWLQLTLRG